MSYAIEREVLVFDNEFKQVNFKEEDLEKDLTLDFNDNQLEIVSPKFDTIEACYIFTASKILSPIFENKKIWPYSYPCNLNLDISIEGMKAEADRKYREKLLQKYEKNMLLTCGIHINYNNDNEVSSNYYFELLKKIYVYSPLLVYLFGYTPINSEQMTLKNAVSLRNSFEYGYRNENKLNLDFSTLDNYIKSIENNIKLGNLVNEKELYSLVKLKPTIHKIKYIELRMFDLFPFNSVGIDKESLLFVEKLLQYLDEIEIKHFDYKKILQDVENVALYGDTCEVEINGKKLKISKHLEDMNEILNTNVYKKVVKNYHNLCDELMNKINEKDNFEASDLELSTTLLINSAKRYNLDYEIINKDKNLIRIENEIIRQATKTSADSYISYELAADKQLTKQLLTRNKIPTPKGYIYKGKLKKVNSKKVVVKPTDTNFGQGISIVNNDEMAIKHAITYANKYSQDIIIEEFVEGKEYRFLVINNEVVSIVYRTPANVVGDGKSNIQNLIHNKNKHPYRGENYSYPLIKIEVSDEIDLDYIPLLNEKVFLNSTSNISTGGDSIEVSHMIPQSYKDSAIRAASALNMKICGVDMIIEDVNDMDGNYNILELNFNPAIHIHKYTYLGDGYDVSDKILKLLKLI